MYWMCHSGKTSTCFASVMPWIQTLVLENNNINTNTTNNNSVAKLETQYSRWKVFLCVDDDWRKSEVINTWSSHTYFVAKETPQKKYPKPREGEHCWTVL
jgi:hypothetical protein